MTAQEIMNEIVNNGCEFEVLKLLVINLEQECIRMEMQVRKHRASLRAIKKINRGENEAINNLCDEKDE